MNQRAGLRRAQSTLSAIEQLGEAVPGWDLDFRQLDRGAMGGNVSVVSDESTLLIRACFDRRIKQWGETPPETLTFALLERSSSALWHERPVDDRQLLVFHDLRAVSAPEFRVHTASIPVERLREAAEATSQEGVVQGLLGEPRAFEGGRVRLHGLRRLLNALHEGPGAMPSGAPTHRTALADNQPRAVLRAFAGDSVELRPPPSQVRDLARRRAVECIEAHPHELLTVADLRRAVGVSERTLEYAFRDRYDLTPKAYLRAMRLHGVRRDLRAAAPGDRIVDIANRWGFWHMGQFAADFRRQFGELPSESLARAAQGTGRSRDLPRYRETATGRPSPQSPLDSHGAAG